MSWLKDKEELTTFAKSFDKSAKLVTKKHWLFLITTWIMFFWSKKARERYMTRFANTIGHLQAYPENWSTEQVADTIPHESRHTQQMRMLGLGIHPIVGALPCLILYGFILFPIYFAIFRVWFEIDADKERWWYWASERGVRNKEVFLRHAKYRALIVAGRDYFYSWNKKHTIKLYTRAAEKFYETYLG